MLRSFHCSAVCSTSQQDQKEPKEASERETQNKDRTLVTHEDIFEQAAKNSKTKGNFNRVVDVFTKNDIRRRGHVEFIYAALKRMQDFGVEQDITVYNKLLDVFPKEVFVPRNFIQRMFNHYPRQQECGVQLLEQMENYGVCLSQRYFINEKFHSHLFVYPNFYRYHAQCRDQSFTGSGIWQKEPSYEKVPAYHVLVSQIQAHKPLPHTTSTS